MSTSDSSGGRGPKRDRAAAPDQSEQARLDDAMQRADELLVTSLKADERRRGQRTLAKMLVAAIALAAMASAATAFFLSDKERRDEPEQVAETVDTPEYLTANQVRAEMLVKEAWQQFKSDRWDGRERRAAVHTFRKATELDPNNIDAWAGLAQASYRIGRLRDAEAAARRVLESNADRSVAINTLARIYLIEHRFEQAEELMLDAFQKNPRNLSAASILGQLYHHLGVTNLAKEWWIKAYPRAGTTAERAKLTPRQIQERKARAQVQRRQEDEQMELPLPVTDDDQTLQAWALLKMDYIGDASRLFQELAADQPKNAEALTGLGWKSMWRTLRLTQSPRSDLDEAKELFEQALSIKPKLPSALHGLARVLEEQGDLEGAIAQWEALLVEHPDYQPALTKLTDVYLEQDQPAKTLPHLKHLAKLRPRDQRLAEKIDAVKKTAGQDAGIVLAK